MHRLRVLGIVFLLFAFSSCFRNQNSQAVQNAAAGTDHSFEVIEVIQGNQYTYIKVVENMNIKWVAVTRQDVRQGESYYYDTELEMNNFHSKEVDRTFDVIYFVNQISKTPVQKNLADGINAHHGKIPVQKESHIQLAKKEGELTLAQIFDERTDFSGKSLDIRGVVVKVNSGIMGKNWIHIQDGTGTDGGYDLTVTTQDMASVNDEVTFKGTLTLNKDFGSGYFYEIILEDAVLVTP